MLTIDWNAFTPWPALIGGIIIGVATALFAMLNGRIAGISGILGGMLRPTRGDISWRVGFLAGMIIAPIVLAAAITLPAPRIDASLPALLVAGFLVGVGTRYGSGCTSGHGVCGLSRLSPAHWSRRYFSWAQASQPSTSFAIS